MTQAHEKLEKRSNLNQGGPTATWIVGPDDDIEARIDNEDDELVSLDMQAKGALGWAYLRLCIIDASTMSAIIDQLTEVRDALVDKRRLDDRDAAAKEAEELRLHDLHLKRGGV